MLRNCTNARYLANKERQLRLARYSHACLTGLRNELDLHYDQSTHGLLILYRRARDLEAATREALPLDRLGIRYRLLDRAACITHEPALGDSRGTITGGMLFPDDESGDRRRFTEQLATHAQQHGVKFTAATSVIRLRRRPHYLCRYRLRRFCGRCLRAGQAVIHRCRSGRSVGCRCIR
jgi:D-amino-acid dehydrogenase